MKTQFPTVADMPRMVWKLKPFVDTVLTTMAHAQLEREKIDKMQREVLTREDGTPMYRTSDEWRERGMRDVPEFVTDPKHAYLMSDDDMEDYHAECQHRIKLMGYSVPEGHCPALIAEDLQAKAEWALIEAAREWFPDVTNDALLCGTKTLGGLEARQKYLDLLIGLVVNAPGGYKHPFARR